MELLNQNELPNNFKYPEEFLKIISQGLIDFEPWIIMDGDYLRSRYEGLKKRYEGTLIPFARKLDNDDLACWHSQQPQKVLIIHDYAAKGWEKRKEFKNFWQWFKQVVDDMIDHNE